MWKFIVTWVLITQTPIPCPDAGKKNEFGQGLNISCGAYHCRTDTDTLSKVFTEREKAFEFYKKAKHNEINYFFNPKITAVKIDSVKVKYIPE